MECCRRQVCIIKNKLKNVFTLINSFASSPAPEVKKLPNIKTRTGIVGIERSLQEKHKATDENINQAFQDLNKLMTMAKDMVNISKSISQKIRVSLHTFVVIIF